MNYKILVLSDLHLGEKESDPRYSHFLEVIKRFLNSNYNELILMGDVFDILIGNKTFWKKIHPDFFAYLSEFKKTQKKLTWVQGNHDFQLKELLAPYEVNWVEDDALLTRNKTKIVVSHGDLADENDHLHHLWRSFLTSWILRLFILLVPNFLAEKVLYPFTLKLSRCSRKKSKTGTTHPRSQKLFRDYASKLKMKHEAQLVILGHSHISDYTAISDSSHYLNLGSWFDKPQIATIDVLNSSFDVKVMPLTTWLSE